MGNYNTAMAAVPLQDFSLLTQLQTYLDAPDTKICTKVALSSLKYCNRMPITNQGVDVLVEGDTVAKYVGLAHCGSMWCCPACTPYRLRKYAEKIDALIRGRRSRFEENAYMFTLTVPHYADESAATILERLYGGRRKLFGSTWNYRRQIYEISGIVQSVEATYGRSGWHFHMHILMFFKDGSSVNQRVLGLFEKIQKDWNSYVEQFERGAHFKNTAMLSKDTAGNPRVIESGQYICGWGAKEMAKASNEEQLWRKGRTANRNVFELLGSGNSDDIERFAEYAVATRGKKRIFISRRLNMEMAPEDWLEKDLDEIYIKKNPEAVATFTSDGWHTVCEADRQACGKIRLDVLRAAMGENRTGALARIRDVLEIHGLPSYLALAPTRRYKFKAENSWDEQSDISAKRSGQARAVRQQWRHVVGAAGLFEYLEQNNAITDHNVDAAFDLSKVLWIVTAEDAGTVPKPLRDRIKTVTLSSYTEQEKLEIERILARKQKAAG